ncbi:MAG: prepilin-type N-terminal cleavage/methylation domain-containing protein [SAR324 cluster bacterium]|nr:prepilin-type N-terminal cleavage/methylation domain-containing protein [SAR324 cluster bacterium]MBL7035640.1 prepilin-type N-terminal cleavage/methylation domain-containing protein [SAR324 cluster bacterium]
MQTLIPVIYKNTTKFKNRGISRGFTFLEILVVITLVLLLMGMSIPQFFALFSKPHEAEFKHLNNVIKTLRNDAVLKSTAYCLIFDLKLQQMFTAEETPTGKCREEHLNSPKILKPHNYSGDLILSLAQPAAKDHTALNSAADLLEVHINNSGFVTPFWLKFSLPDYTKSWTIESRGIMGSLLLLEQ